MIFVAFMLAKEFLKNYNAGMEKKEILIYSNKLRMYCSKDTCYPKMRENWKEDDPFFGHSAIIAVCIYDKFGGNICKGSVNGTREAYYWNEIEGEKIDVTGLLFKKDIKIEFSNYKTRKEILKNNKNFKERYLKFVDKLKRDYVI